MNLVKIKDSEYMRDMATNAIVSVNREEIEAFNRQRKRILEEKQEKEETKTRLTKIEEEMSEIKQLLREIAQSRSSNGN